MDIDNQKNLLDEPIGKKKPFQLFLMWFLYGLVGSISIQWLLLEPFDLYKYIFKVDTAWPWFYFVLVSFLMACSSTTLRLTLYYRKIYRQYRSQALVDNLYITRSELQGKYMSLIKNAKKSVDVFGMSLHTLIQNPEIRDAIVESATGTKKVFYRFLIHDPNCCFLKERAKQEGKKEKRISEDSEMHLSDLLSMKKSVEEKSGNIEIRTLKDKMPDCFYLRQDYTLFVEPYLMGYTGRDCPVISINKNEINSPVFDAFIKAMDRKWNVADKK